MKGMAKRATLTKKTLSAKEREFLEAIREPKQPISEAPPLPKPFKLKKPVDLIQIVKEQSL